MLPSKTVLQVWWRNQKLSRQAKGKRVQHHHTSFITNAKGTSLGRKHTRRKRPIEKTQDNLENGNRIIYIYIYILITNLNVNGLNIPTKRHRLAEQMKTCSCMHFHLPHHSVWPHKLYVICVADTILDTNCLTVHTVCWICSRQSEN